MDGINQIIEEQLDSSLRRALITDSISVVVEGLEEKLPDELVERQLEIMAGIDAYGQVQQRKNLRAIHRKHFEKAAITSSKNKLLYKIFLAALGGLILFASVSVIMSKYFSKTPNAIYAEYYKPYKYSYGQRAAAEKSLISLGVLYNEQDFDGFLELYETHFKNDQILGSDIILASGIAYLETNQPYKAIFQFSKIIKNEDFNYLEAASWYEALALVKAGEYTLSIEKLEVLRENVNSIYSDDSKKLIKDLEFLTQF